MLENNPFLFVAMIISIVALIGSTIYSIYHKRVDLINYTIQDVIILWILIGIGYFMLQ